MVKCAVLAIGSILVLVSVLPLASENAWWVRMWDFPSPQIAACIGITLAASMLALCQRRWSTRVLNAALLTTLLLRACHVEPI